APATVVRTNVRSAGLQACDQRGPLRPACHFEAPSPRGKAEVCKTSTPGSNPGGASTFPRKSEAHRSAGRVSVGDCAQIVPDFAALRLRLVRPVKVIQLLRGFDEIAFAHDVV